MEVHLPIDGGASGMGILPMLPGARPRARCPCQCDSARQTLPSIGRCGRRMARMKNGRRGPECQDREPTGAGRCAERRGQTAGAGFSGARRSPASAAGGSAGGLRIAPLSGLGSRFAVPGNALPSFRRRNALPGAASLRHKQVMIVGVHPLAGFDKLLHYRVPETLRGAVGVGSLVRVPVLQRHRLGIVGEIGEPVGFPLEKLKSISQVVHPFPALPPDLLQLARWISAYYAAGLDTVIEAMLPAAVRGGATLKQERLLRWAGDRRRRAGRPCEARAPAGAALRFSPPAIQAGREVAGAVAPRPDGGGVECAGQAGAGPGGDPPAGPRRVRRRLGPTARRSP